MRLGFLHLGRPGHGVRRFGQWLAGAAKQVPGLTVLEVELTLEGNPQQDLPSLLAAAQTLSTADIVQIQFTEEIWGSGSQRLANLRQFVGSCGGAIAVTIHDTEAPGDLQPLPLPQRLKRWLKPWLHQWGWVAQWEPDNVWIRQWLMRHTQLQIVCTTEEQQRLAARNPRSTVVVIPHFVEPRPHLPNREAARQILGLADRQVVTLLGFIFGGKGHHLLLQALRLIPNANLLVVFAGGSAPGSEAILADLKYLAAQAQVNDRLRITGYLSEAELEQYLVATDVPVCPFEVCFASGSLASWISAGRRVLASDLPQFRESDQLEPGSVQIFAPYTAEALAGAIQARLTETAIEVPPAVQRLRDRLSLANTFGQHLFYYRQSAPSIKNLSQN